MIKIFESTFASEIKTGVRVVFLNRDWEVVSTEGTMTSNIAVTMVAFDNREKITVWK